MVGPTLGHSTTESRLEVSGRILPPSQRQDRHASETAFTVVPFVDLPGVSQNPMLFVNHLKSYNHNVSQEVDQTFFVICEDESVRRVVFYCADSPGAVDRAIQKLVPLGTPDGVKVRAVVMFAESWSNDTPEVVAHGTWRELQSGRPSWHLRHTSDNPGRTECSRNVDQQVGWYDTEPDSGSLGRDEGDEVQTLR